MLNLKIHDLNGNAGVDLKWSIKCKTVSLSQCPQGRVTSQENVYLHKSAHSQKTIIHFRHVIAGGAFHTGVMLLKSVRPFGT